jgi:hypothetical protein
MSNTSPIKIVVSQGTGTQASNQPTSPAPNQTSPSNAGNGQAKQKTIFETTAFAAASHIARTAVNTSISQYANITGDYITGNKLNAVNNLIGYAVAIAKGGPLGVLYTAVSIGQSVVSEYISFVKNEREIEMMRKRAGFLNGSVGLTND